MGKKCFKDFGGGSSILSGPVGLELQCSKMPFSAKHQRNSVFFHIGSAFYFGLNAHLLCTALNPAKNFHAFIGKANGHVTGTQ